MTHRPPWTQSGGEVVLTYSGATIPHKAKFPVKFATTPVPGDDPSLTTRGGTPVDFSAAIVDFVTTAYEEQFNSDTSTGAAEIYKVDPDTGERTFLYGINTNGVGENVAENVPFTESVWVFKTVGGHPLKIFTMESVYAPDSRNVGTVPADARQDMLDYILNDANWICGHDATFPLIFKSFTSKINDVLRKRGGFSDV